MQVYVILKSVFQKNTDFEFTKTMLLNKFNNLKQTSPINGP